MLPRRGRSATVRQWWHMTSSEDEQIVDLPSSGEEEEPKRAKLAATKAGSHEGAQASGSLLGVAPPAQSVSAAAAAATPTPTPTTGCTAAAAAHSTGAAPSPTVDRLVRD